MLERLIVWLKKHGFALYLSVLIVVLALLIYNHSVNKSESIDTFQQAFTESISKNEANLQQVIQDYHNLSKEQFSERYIAGSSNFIIHIYRSDSLVYWNTNKFPVSNYADIRFPVNGLIRLQNGWYYSVLEKQGAYVFVSTFGIKRVFPYQNNQLNDYFFKPFPELNAHISLDGNAEKQILDKKGVKVFNLEFKEDKARKESRSEWIFSLVLLTVFSIYLRFYYKLFSTWKLLVLSIGLLVLRLMAFHYHWFSFMENTPLFDPGLMALNTWISNAGEALIWLMVIVLVGITWGKCFRLIGKKWVKLVLSLSLPWLSIAVPAVYKWIITNSTIPIDLHNLLYLNWFTAGFVFSLALCGFLLIRLYFLNWNLVGRNWLSALYFIGTILVVNEFVFRLHGFWIIWLFLLYIATGFSYLKQRNQEFSHQLLLVFVISWGVTFNAITEATKKEHEDRVLFANQLADDRDLNAEVDFTMAREKLIDEPYLKRLFSSSKPSFSELKEAMEYRVFNGYWDRFDVDFYFFDEQDTTKKRMNGISEAFLEELIDNHGVRSDMDSSLFFIQDYTSQYNYIFHLHLKQDNKEIALFGTLRSKRIPEKIGFPRILISKQTAVFESLERYTIAKYFKNQLVTIYGNFAYPSQLSKLDNSQMQGIRFIRFGNVEHLILRKSDSDVIVLTANLPTWIDYLTSTSIMLVVLSIFFFIGFFLYRILVAGHLLEFNMATKIQLALIGLIVLSLIGFSVASSSMLSNQYGEYEHEQLRDKVRSLEKEIEIRQANNLNTGYIWDRKESFDYQVRRWSNLFQTDINLFDVQGRLIGSSRSKIFTIGLLGDRMNSSAVLALKDQLSSEFIHEENIGNLTYLSGYCPIYSHDHEVLGYLNLLQFDKQNAFQNELRQFFVAIMNVFMLLLVVSILMAVVVSSWITKPLQLLRNSFAQVELGKNNQRIDYKSKDEIGYLVAEYNHKLTELAEAVAKIAQSERESAWREMAKQVAHEIKNPLTPMKLSVQHLQRVFDPNDPSSKTKIDKVTASLIEQIDALTSIANAFSNFAKLPQPKMSPIEVNGLVQTVVDFFHQESNALVTAQLFESELRVNGDKEMLLRVLNNLITNGIQAAISGSKPEISVSIALQEDRVLIRVKDNGTGIEADQAERIFEPYFTTKSTGTGLGLAMVKQIVEQHDGTIYIEHTDSKGTTFCISLPLITD